MATATIQEFFLMTEGSSDLCIWYLIDVSSGDWQRLAAVSSVSLCGKIPDVYSPNRHLISDPQRMNVWHVHKETLIIQQTT